MIDIYAILLCWIFHMEQEVLECALTVCKTFDKNLLSKATINVFSSAAFYAYAFQGALVHGSEYRLWDILCPDSIRITMETYNEKAISWSKPRYKKKQYPKKKY